MALPDIWRMEVSYDYNNVTPGWLITASNGKRIASTLVTDAFLKEHPENALAAVTMLANLAFKEIQQPEIDSTVKTLEQQLG